VPRTSITFIWLIAVCFPLSNIEEASLKIFIASRERIWIVIVAEKAKNNLNKNYNKLGMKILHLSDNGLPDARVERAALTGKREGHITSFAGPFVKGTALSVKSFDKSFTMPFNKFANAKVPSYWRVLKRKLSEILSEYRPDLIHAHNIVAAKLASESSIPFLYDDHEYWSKRCGVFAKIWKPNKMYIKWLWTRWENEVLRKAFATITVSNTIAEEHGTICSCVYVVPNFPSRIETQMLEPNLYGENHLSSVYIGSDFSPSLAGRSSPYRNLEGYLEIFNHNDIGTLTVIGDSNLSSSQNINSLGSLPHQLMMEELTKHHIGLLPWKKHWYHRYCNPNKPYEYAHAGLLVLATSDFINVKRHLKKFCVLFNDEYELKKLLLYYVDNLNEVRRIRSKIRNFALENLIWEKQCEPEILKAYTCAG